MQQYFLKEGGAPRGKLVMGLSFSARSFTLAKRLDLSWDHSLGAPISGRGTEGRYTGEPGILSYYEVFKTIVDLTKL